MSASLSGQKTISGLHTTAITLSAGAYADPTTNVGTIDLAAAGTAVVAASAWTLDNAGLIVATASATDFGISFAAGGFVDNEAGAVITAATPIYNAGAAGLTVLNAGTIQGAMTSYSGGTLTNTGLIDNASGNAVAIYRSFYLAGGAWWVDNQSGGMIRGGSVGVQGAATVVNAASATIDGGQVGITYENQQSNGIARVTNAGTVTAQASAAVVVTGSALIDNQAGGVIAGASGVQDSNNGFGSTNQGYGVRNDGLISGSLGNGIYLGWTGLGNAGSVTNLSQGTIVGAISGVRIPGGEFPVVNDGTIEGGQFGVYLNGHGSVDNSGLITGTTAAVYFDAAAGVILNRASGTIGSVLFGAFTPAQIDDFGTLGMVTFSNSLPSYAHNIVTVEPGASLAGLGNTLVAGDTIELAATIVQYVTFGSNNMLTLSGGATLDLAQGAGRIQVSNDGINTFITACFAQGTRIATSRGPVAVEALCEGDRLLTASGRLAPVRWLGHRRTDLKRHPSPHDVMPVRVTAGAFGPSLPSRDLVLSPDHAVFVDGHLVPVRHLVNGASIVQETRASITYWHVELDRHDVILAEGLPCESYLDTGNRHAFEGGSALALHPDFGRDHALGVWAEQGCAPILTEPSAPALRTVHLRLLARAA